MPSYFPPKKNTQYIMYIGLPSQASSHIFQSNPTLAAGDAKVSIDGGALANLTTLPAVTPASSKMVKVTLSAAEMNGDNITVVMSDASGAEWRDVIINIQTATQQIDDIPGSAAIADAVWDEAISGHVTSATFGHAVQMVRHATAQAGAAGTITLDASASSVDDRYNGCLVAIISGTGAGQVRLITDYVGSTKVASVTPNFDTAPGATSIFTIYPAGYLQGIAAGGIAATAFASGALDADALAADAVNEIADAVWDEAYATHVTAGSFGQALGALHGNAAQAGAAGTITLDASASAVDDFYNGTLIFLTNGTGANQARLITDYVGATKVATISPNWVTNPAASTGYVIMPWASIPSLVALGTGAISAASFAAGAIDAAAIAADAIGSSELAASAVTEIQSGLATTSQLTTVEGKVDTVDTVADAIKAKTDNLPASPAATGDIPTAAAIADAVLDEAIPEPSGVFTWSGSLRSIIGWLGALGRNRMTQTASTSTLRNDANSGDIATSGVSDDGTTFTRDEWS